MFVVRLSNEDRSDFKVFEKKPDAEARFWGGWFKIKDYEDPSAALYEVANETNPKDAIAAVKARKSDVSLLEIMPIQLNIDLSEYGL